MAHWKLHSKGSFRNTANWLWRRVQALEALRCPVSVPVVCVSWGAWKAFNGHWTRQYGWKVSAHRPRAYECKMWYKTSLTNCIGSQLDKIRLAKCTCCLCFERFRILSTTMNANWYKSGKTQNWYASLLPMYRMDMVLRNCSIKMFKARCLESSSSCPLSFRWDHKSNGKARKDLRTSINVASETWILHHVYYLYLQKWLHHLTSTHLGMQSIWYLVARP